MKAIIIARHKRLGFVGAVAKNKYLSGAQPAQLFDLIEARRICDRMIDAYSRDDDWMEPAVLAVEE